MKNIICFLLLSAVFTTTAKAENYPYRSDYLWVTIPDHADWLYQSGEEATIEVEFFKYGISHNLLVEYEIADDMLKADTKGKVEMKNGRCTIPMGTRLTPGFRDLRLSTTLDGKTYHHHIKVGFSVDKIQPYTKQPSDFKAFWEENIQQMESFPLTYEKELAKEYCTDKADCYLVKLFLNKQKQAIYGYLFIPKDAKPKSCPVVLCPPGAGIKTIKEPLRHRYYADSGCIRMEVEIHGLDPRLSDEVFTDISRAFNGKENGYLTIGLEDKDRYYMKRVYLSMVRCIDFLTSLEEWDNLNVIVQGGSQGGALSIIAAGLDDRITQCIANHPALSDMAAYSAGGTGGYPHFNKIDGMFSQEKINTMAYYDVVNFARYVKANTFMTWGFNDDTCPPTTSYAVWNTLKCPKEALITPINEHWTSEETEQSLCEWMLENLKH
ncbi:MAG: acetylxylan esterase [Prevotella sp.]|nr:acetylxylan esterase [Prevotella sp.]